MEKKLSKNKAPKFKTPFFSLLLMLILLNSICYLYNIKLAMATIIITIIFLIYYIISIKKTRSEINNSIKKSISAAGEASKFVNINMPIPMIICDETGNLLWYNDAMSSIIQLEKISSNRNIESLIPGFDFNKILNLYKIDENEITNVEELKTKNSSNEVEKFENSNTVSAYSNNKFYEITSMKHLNSDNSNTQFILYFYDLTLYKDYEERYEDERAIVSILEVDSYDDVMNESSEGQRPKLQAEIEDIIISWAKRMNALIKKYDKAKYIVIASNRYFQNEITKKFDILDRIREIEVESSFPITLSIGVCTDDVSYIEMERSAFSALEIALGRGGDQAAVKIKGEYEFFGGKSKAVEKRNKVKARIVAHAFKPILDESDFVYVMGHQYPDMDALGAAVGIYKMAKDRGKQTKIVLEKPNETIKLLYDTFEDSAEEMFIKPDEAIFNFDSEKDLLVVVDTHRASFTESPKLIKMAERRVVVDHHRRSVDIIDNTLLTYLESYASSACELVAEMLPYMEKKVNLSKREADALLAGIVLDTKNFSIKAGVRTFETAAMLRKFGADTMSVKAFMQDDIESIVARSNIVSNARTYNDYIAISVTDKDINNPRLIAAQAADQMLTVKGITTSFVIVHDDSKVYISARAIKDVNVQVIMEGLGGGGHLTGAGAQFEDISVYEAEKLLIKQLNKYLEEEKQ